MNPRFLLAALLILPATVDAQVAVHGETVHTAAGAPIVDGIVLVRDGRIEAVGPASSVTVPVGWRVLKAKVVTPGFVDAHGTVGVSGLLNQAHDQDQREGSAPLQPELRAVDAYNPQDGLVDWVRSFGVTTVHTGHGPGAVISGQTMVVKTTGQTVEDAVIVPEAMVAATLGSSARAGEQGKAPGTRAKMAALLRGELVKAQEYQRKLATPATATKPADRKAGKPAEDKTPERNLRLEALVRVLKREMPLLVTAERAQDIVTALRIAQEFDSALVIDGASEGPLVADRLKAAGVPVIVHPTMARADGDRENLSFETASRLKAAGVRVALQTGFEAYVPKTRVLPFEAAVAAAHGLGFDGALAAITIDAARILGLEKRIGSLEVGKDGDLALFDGDPFEYTSHCVGVVIDGKVVSEVVR